MGETRRVCSPCIIDSFWIWTASWNLPRGASAHLDGPQSPLAPDARWGSSCASLALLPASSPLTPPSCFGKNPPPPPHPLPSSPLFAFHGASSSARAWVCGAAVRGCDFRNRQRVALMSCRCWHVCSHSGYLCVCMCSGCAQWVGFTLEMPSGAPSLIFPRVLVSPGGGLCGPAASAGRKHTPD